MSQKETKFKTETADINQLRNAVLQWTNLRQKEGYEVSANKEKVLLPKNDETLMPLKKIKKHNHPKRFYRALTSIIFLFLSIVGLVIIGGFGIYYGQWNNQFITVITRIIPYPAAIVDYRPIPYIQWQSHVASLTSYYQKMHVADAVNSLPSSRIIKRQAMDQLIQAAYVSTLADYYAITVTDDEIAKQIQNLSDELGSPQALVEQINDIYGWDLAQFGKEVIKPILLKNKIAVAVILDDRINQGARQQIENIAERLKSEPEEFEQLAHQYTEDATASRDGDLGYFTTGEMVPEFEAAVSKLEVGQISNIVKTRFGYHVIRLDEKIVDEATGAIQYRARQILVRGKDVDSYVAELEKEKPILQLVHF